MNLATFHAIVLFLSSRVWKLLHYIIYGYGGGQRPPPRIILFGYDVNRFRQSALAVSDGKCGFSFLSIALHHDDELSAEQLHFRFGEWLERCSITVACGTECGGSRYREREVVIYGRAECAVLVLCRDGDEGEVVAIGFYHRAVGFGYESHGGGGGTHCLGCHSLASLSYATTFSSPGSYTTSFQRRR